MPTLEISRLPHAEGLDPPAYATAGSAGLDLVAALHADVPMVLGPGERRAVPAGFCLAIPEGYEGQVRARSGRCLREGLAVLNAPGTIDSDYRGELHVILANLGSDPIEIRRGDRVAQLVIAPVARVAVVMVETRDLAPTSRADGGFGSTGR